MRRRKGRRRPAQEQGEHRQAEYVEAGGKPVSELGAGQAVPEAAGVPQSELAAREALQEAAGVPISELAAEEHPTAELPGSEQYRL